MESSLDSILSDQPAVNTEVTQQTEAETPPTQEVTEETTGTGEETGTPPEQPHKDDPLDKARKGLEAAAAAERKKRQDAEARAEAARQELEALRRQYQPQQQAPAQASQEQQQEEPKREDFASDVDYIRALARHEAKLMREAEKVQEAKEREEREAAERAEAKRTKSEGIVAAAMALEGFDLQAFARVPVTDDMLDAILESDAGDKLVHFLATNPQEASRIAGLSKARQIAELTRIEDRLKAPQQEQEETPAKPRPQLPNTLTQARDTRGRFEKSDAYDGPTPLNAILK
jgi:hypothetical protein